MIKILPTFNPIFRGERKEPEKQVETYFSNEERNNSAGNGSYKIELLNKNDQKSIGTITYDYDLNEKIKMIKIRTVGVSPEYQRQEFSMQLYHRLLDLVKEKGLAGIRSDEIVQGGALA
jgi:N-acetylglutamate synthase-like GNAT family acetyltransferase